MMMMIPDSTGLQLVVCYSACDSNAVKIQKIKYTKYLSLPEKEWVWIWCMIYRIKL